MVSVHRMGAMLKYTSGGGGGGGGGAAVFIHRWLL